MKKIHIGNNKSLANPASTDKIVPSYGISYGDRMHILRG